MTQVDGTAWVLDRTGHSIHAERPEYFSGRIVEFLSDVPPASAPPFLINAVLYPP